LNISTKMNPELRLLKSEIIRLCSYPRFIHHQWFVKYHLEIVERIVNEACQFYPKADQELLQGLIWMHDYAKIVDFEKKDDFTVFEKAIPMLTSFGFTTDYISRQMKALSQIENKLKEDINKAPLEVKILSSADGASHFFGPFFEIYFAENSSLPIEELMLSNLKKIDKDVTRKIVIPEIMKAVQTRIKFLKEQNGILPKRYLS